jgi:hypothetical protein
MRAPILCRPRYPERDKLIDVARQARAIRPDNVPADIDLDGFEGHERAEQRGRLMLDVKLRWPKTSGAHLTVGFYGEPSKALRLRILRCMNMWSQTANVSFRETADVGGAQVRIAQTPGDGHWSWLGIDILNHAGPTMNLDGFDDDTDDDEVERVVCHEAGHTLGFPHEHLHPEIVGRLDHARTIAFYEQDQNWTRADVIAQLLKKLDTKRHLGTAPDELSIMCYQVPGACTIDGEPIVGGIRINDLDRTFAAEVYPR